MTSASSGRRAACPPSSPGTRPSDLVGFAADAGADPTDPATREAQLLGAPVPDVPDLAAQASPITHVSPAAPPFLLLHGAADRFIPCVQSERLYAALVEAGAEVELDLYEDADHMWLGSPEAAAAGARPHDRRPAPAPGAPETEEEDR